MTRPARRNLIFGGMLLAIGLLLLAACEDPEMVDNAGYTLPGKAVELASVRAFLEIVPRAELQERARAGGTTIQHGTTVNGLSRWIGEPGVAGGACFIALAADRKGLAALEHELWHCKAGAWHP